MWVIKPGDTTPTLIEDATLPYWQGLGYAEWGGSVDVNDPALRAAFGSSSKPVSLNAPRAVPALTKLTPTVATRAQVGLDSIYVPWLLKVPDAVYATYPSLGRWRIYTSTDHDNAAGGIALLTTAATDPTSTGTTWTPYRGAGNAVSIFDEGGTSQTETPCVVWNPATSLFHLYYQIANGTIQRTRVVTSADGVTGWSAPRDAIPNLPSTVAGYNHTGYARVWNIDGLWCAYHLIGSGTGTSGYGWSYSYDGLTFVTDRRRVHADLQDTDGVLRLGMSGLFDYRGELWGIGTQTEYTSGTVSSSLKPVWLAPMSTDLRSIKGRPQRTAWELATGEVSSDPPSPPTAWESLPDGRLVGAYKVSAASASNDSFRLAVLS